MRLPAPGLTRSSGTTLAPAVRQTMTQQARTARTAPVGERLGPRTHETLPASGSASAVAIEPGEILAFSIAEFCRRHGISRAHFYNLRNAGDAPMLMRVGRRALISAEAAAHRATADGRGSQQRSSRISISAHVNP